ncbi:MAG: family 43 glycosylhydrolase [Clostridia bacterium]|nr:family 43 glycosylhydrolase [Clostridia bacterium]
MYRFSNPNTQPGNIRDPFIINVDGVYYLTGSFPPFWEGPVPGIKLFRSTDLVNWTYVTDIIRRADMPEDCWCIDKLWAPEILRRPEGFYLTFNGRNQSAEHPHNHGVAIAFAEKIEGPYRLLTREDSILADVRHPIMTDPSVMGNDGSLYEDESGIYLFYSNRYGIWGLPVSLPECKAAGEVFRCVAPSPEGCWDTKIEGPYVVKRHGKYFLFYSSFTGPYSVGCVTAENIRGPWSPNPPAPLITPPEGGEITHSGHNVIFEGSDGRLYTCYHMQRRSDPTEYLAIDPIELMEDGSVSTPAPTLG